MIEAEVGGDQSIETPLLVGFGLPAESDFAR